MARKLNPTDIQHAAKLLDEGHTLKQTAETVKISEAALVKHLRKMGVRTDRRAGRPASNRLPLDTAEIAEAYLSGESELALAKKHNTSRDSIRIRLVEAGIAIRDASEASFNRMRKLTPDQKIQLTRAAVTAATGKSRTQRFLENRAAACVRVHGSGEKEIFDALVTKGLNPEKQAACGVYNVDIRIGDIAVEICGQKTHRLNDPDFLNRLKYLLDHGYSSVALIFFRDFDSFLGNFDHIITHLERTYREPPSERKNWMIRCSFQAFTRFRNDLGQFAVKPAPKTYFYVFSEMDFSESR